MSVHLSLFNNSVSISWATESILHCHITSTRRPGKHEITTKPVSSKDFEHFLLLLLLFSFVLFRVRPFVVDECFSKKSLSNRNSYWRTYKLDSNWMMKKPLFFFLLFPGIEVRNSYLNTDCGWNDKEKTKIVAYCIANYINITFSSWFQSKEWESNEGWKWKNEHENQLSLTALLGRKINKMQSHSAKRLNQWYVECIDQNVLRSNDIHIHILSFM